MTWYVVSDLHLGDGSKKDNFQKNSGSFSKFLDKVSDEKASLAIAGDFFELWQCNIFDIFKIYHKLLIKMFSLNPIIVIGNHDIDLIQLVNLDFTFSKNIYSEGYHIPKSKIYVEHGNAYDAWNDPNRNLKAGRLITNAVGYFENVDPEAEKNLSKIWTGMKSLFSLDKPVLKETWDWNTPANSLEPDIDKYIRGAKRRIRKSKNTDNRIWRIVMGHTHQEGFTKDYTVFNSGSWVTDKPAFAEADEKKNEVRIKYWPSEEELERPEHWKRKRKIGQ